MVQSRYAQFCPLACAAEILGERWTLLILRELCIGPQRFSDLRRRLPGISPSVLTERLERLEQREIVARRQLAPPTPASLYELTSLGRELEPALAELARWGTRFLSTRRPVTTWSPIGFAWVCSCSRGRSPRRRARSRSGSPTLRARSPFAWRAGRRARS